MKASTLTRPSEGATAAAPKPKRLSRAPQRPVPATAAPAPGLEAPASTAVKHQPMRGDLALYLMLATLVGVAWQISRSGMLKPNSDASYWIAVAGGSMMLLLFSYPLRKYVRFMRGLGRVKWWFWLHLFLGIAGPWLILVHSSFHIGSLNAGVAIVSMGIVVASGVIGRFIYVRIHRGLHGEQSSLHELRIRAGMVESNARSRLHFLPTVEARLLAFEQCDALVKPSLLTHLRRIAVLPIQQRLTYLRCVADAHRRLRELAAAQDWSADDLRRRERNARRLAGRYLNAVVRVAQYSAYERLFALWHMAHLPFVYLLIVSAIVHVIAVHAY